MMRFVTVPLPKTCYMARKITTSATLDKLPSLEGMSKATQLAIGIGTIVLAAAGGGYAIHTVDAKLLALDARLTATVTGSAKELEAKVAGSAKELDAKLAGVKETITKEVDAKLAGTTKELDAKVAGSAKELDAKVAGIKESVSKEVAGVSDKAKAEALMVLKDYGVSNVPLLMASMPTIWGNTVMNGFHVSPHLPFPLSIPSNLLYYVIYYRCLLLVVWQASHRASSDKERQKQIE